MLERRNFHNFSNKAIEWTKLYIFRANDHKSLLLLSGIDFFLCLLALKHLWHGVPYLTKMDNIHINKFLTFFYVSIIWKDFKGHLLLTLNQRKFLNKYIIIVIYGSFQSLESYVGILKSSLYIKNLI